MEMDVKGRGGSAYADMGVINRVPVACFTRPDDVAEAIAFLADASWESLRLRTRA